MRTKWNRSFVLIDKPACFCKIEHVTIFFYYRLTFIKRQEIIIKLNQTLNTSQNTDRSVYFTTTNLSLHRCKYSVMYGSKKLSPELQCHLHIWGTHSLQCRRQRHLSLKKFNTVTAKDINKWQEKRSYYFIRFYVFQSHTF